MGARSLLYSRGLSGGVARADDGRSPPSDGARGPSWASVAMAVVSREGVARGGSTGMSALITGPLILRKFHYVESKYRDAARLGSSKCTVNRLWVSSTCLVGAVEGGRGGWDRGISGGTGSGAGRDSPKNKWGCPGAMRLRGSPSDQAGRAIGLARSAVAPQLPSCSYAGRVRKSA